MLPVGARCTRHAPEKHLPARPAAGRLHRSVQPASQSGSKAAHFRPSRGPAKAAPADGTSNAELVLALTYSVPGILLSSGSPDFATAMRLHFQEWITLVASILAIAMAVLVIWRARRSPLALPLALLSIDFCCFNLAAMFYELSGVHAFFILDHATSPLGISLGLHFVLAFVGRRERFRLALVASYLVSGTIAATSPLSLVSRSAARFVDTRNVYGVPAGWEMANLLHLAVVSVFGLALLVQHYRRARGFEERARTRVVLTAISVLIVGGGSELLPNIDGAGPAAMTLFTLLLSAVTLRLGLFDVRVPTRFIPAAVLVGVLSVAALFGLFRGWNPTAALLLLLAMFSFLVVLTIAVGIYAARAVAAERLERMALLGRFSAQLAHNLKNPLAALKGGAQFLKVELALGRSIEEQQDFVELLLEQIQRLEGAIEEYQRLGKADPVKVRLPVNDVVRSVLALQAFIDPARVEVKAELDPALPLCEADPQLLQQALENLMRNAFEAMPGGGEVTVSTHRGLGEVVIAVSDTGCGMDARTQERALKEFYTTKPAGSGLGLAFVRRVAEKHNGRVRITSREGEGTTVRLSLPV